MLALRRTRTLLGPRGVEGLQDPRVTGDRIQLWHHQGADHRTDVQAKPLFWWELPGFDYHDWSRSKADYNVRHGFSATSALSLNLRPAARIRFRGKFKGWGLRAIGWAIFLCSISWIWNINLSKRAWIDTSDEMKRWSFPARSVIDAEIMLRDFLLWQGKDYRSADCAARSPLMRDRTFYHNVEVQESSEWGAFNNLYNPASAFNPNV